ncbi:aldehyde dehydrogenase family protein [Novosphingobium sp. P6W]|uniref:aldehyde dehydrogenase family protein n=1 Tax=Novosphingobium sp. P6W TaxID=1609758 RepID=UPI0005C2C6DA|nr:aldehyde dehydrogenase family protein [Novosphingobium sp. P6W]AXB75954.1 aldehyde dehydrogenase family protein [Novosphingobium sp. P6W]KIS31157.1 aldehyde dehydrogenase [Novosphingobium sp. P6W]
MGGGFIEGRWVTGLGAPFTVENPSTGAVVTSVTGMSLEQISDAIRAARHAFDAATWADLPFGTRAEIVRRYVAALETRADKIIDLIALETGCPRFTSSMRSQVQTPLAQAHQIIDLAQSLPDYEDNPLPIGERVNLMNQPYQSLRHYTPVGVVAAIAAYNFPFLTALWKVIPALITGNTVVLRPSPLTPLSAAVFGEAAEEAGLPPGVLNLVLERGTEGGQLLTTHADVDMVAFTGSTSVGVQVMQQAAATMKRLQLELGGKSAQIFLPDAIDKVVPVMVGACTAHAGQGCALGTRIFVPEADKPAILEKIRTAFAAIRIGGADDPSTQLGPVISAAQRARCEHFVALAVERGGVVVTGGRRPAAPGEGFFFEPTVLDLPDNSNPAAQEEIFGPVLCIIGYRDLDHAVQMANDSRYGLSGYVFGADRRKALEVGLRIKSGTVNVNGAMMSSYVSAGGQRMSGVGRERGIEGIRLYQQLTCINMGA